MQRRTSLFLMICRVDYYTDISSERKIVNKCTTRFSYRVASFARHDNDNDDRIFARSFEDGPRRHFRRARSKFFRSKASQNSLVSGDDDTKLARLTAQFRGRDDAKKKEQDGKRKERSETRGGHGTRERKKKGGGIYWPEYLRGVELDAPPPESRSWLRSSVYVACTYVYVWVYRVHVSMLRERVRTRVCARVSTCVKRDVATQAGMQFRNARVAHEASPTLLHHLSAVAVLFLSRPLLVTGRNEGRGR